MSLWLTKATISYIILKITTMICFSIDLMIGTFYLWVLVTLRLFYFSHYWIHYRIVFWFSSSSEFIPEIIRLLQVALIHFVLGLCFRTLSRYRIYKLIATRSSIFEGISLLELVFSELSSLMSCQACHDLSVTTIVNTTLCLLFDLFDVLHLFVKGDIE